MPRVHDFGLGFAPAGRVGLSLPENSLVTEDELRQALDFGINFWMWTGTPNAISRAISSDEPLSRRVVVAVQLDQREAPGAKQAFDDARRTLGVDMVDIVSVGPVSEYSQWEQLKGPGGALAAVQDMKERGQARAVAVSSRDPDMLHTLALSGRVDVVFGRYSLRRRSMETVLFPLARKVRVHVVVENVTEGGTLLADAAGRESVTLAECLRFAMEPSEAAVALHEPRSGEELRQMGEVLRAYQPLAPGERERLSNAVRGKQVYRTTP